MCAYTRVRRDWESKMLQKSNNARWGCARWYAYMRECIEAELCVGVSENPGGAEIYWGIFMYTYVYESNVK